MSSCKNYLLQPEFRAYSADYFSATSHYPPNLENKICNKPDLHIFMLIWSYFISITLPWKRFTAFGDDVMILPIFLTLALKQSNFEDLYILGAMEICLSHWWSKSFTWPKWAFDGILLNHSKLGNDFENLLTNVPQPKLTANNAHHVVTLNRFYVVNFHQLRRYKLAVNREPFFLNKQCSEVTMKIRSRSLKSFLQWGLSLLCLVPNMTRIHPLVL